MKTYEDGVKAEKKRILDFLENAGNSLELYATHGKWRLRRAAKQQLMAVVAVIEFVEPEYFNEKS